MYKYNGYINDPDGEGAGGFRLEFFDVVAPSIFAARVLIKKFAKKEYSGFEGKIERVKKVKDKRKPGVYK